MQHIHKWTTTRATAMTNHRQPPTPCPPRKPSGRGTEPLSSSISLCNSSSNSSQSCTRRERNERSEPGTKRPVGRGAGRAMWVVEVPDVGSVGQWTIPVLPCHLEEKWWKMHRLHERLQVFITPFLHEREKVHPFPNPLWQAIQSSTSDFLKNKRQKQEATSNKGIATSSDRTLRTGRSWPY